jgi:hypothetical protein
MLPLSWLTRVRLLGEVAVYRCACLGLDVVYKGVDVHKRLRGGVPVSISIGATVGVEA